MTLLRPDFLLLLLAWLPFCFWLYKKQSYASSWQSIIDPALFDALSGHELATKRKRFFLLPLIGGLIIIALSGPAIENLETRSAHQGNLYVLLDSSLSMAGTDLAPDRMTRAKRMIADWAGSGLFDKTSVIVYAGSAHTLTPLTNDVETLNTQLNPLSPFLMPALGNRADLAFEHVTKHLTSSNLGPAHILWLTDDVPANRLSAIKNAMPDTISKTLVPVGTQAGSPIPLPGDQGFHSENGKIVVVQADIGNITKMGRDLGFSISTVGSQPNALALGKLAKGKSAQSGYADIGFWLLIPIGLLLLFQLNSQVNRGVSASVLLTFILLSPEQSMAFELFKNKNQRAYEALLNNTPEQTIELSSIPELTGQAQFQSEQFEESAQSFLQAPTADALYNAGNALAHAGKLEEAIEAYDQALELAAHDKAKSNKELIEEFLKQQQKQQDQQDSEQGDNSDKQEDSSDSDSQSSESEQSESEQSESEQSSEQDQQSKDEQSASEEESEEESESASESDEQEKGDDEEESESKSAQENTAEEGQQSIEKTAEELKADQEVEAILNQLSSQPGSILQHKFKYQYLQNPTQADGTQW